MIRQMGGKSSVRSTSSCTEKLKMGPDVLLKGQNGFSDCGTLLAHDCKSLEIGEQCPDLLEISRLVQFVNDGKFSFHNIIVKPSSFLLLFYFLKTFYQ